MMVGFTNFSCIMILKKLLKMLINCVLEREREGEREFLGFQGFNNIIKAMM